jgi:hypothetical protein
MTQSVVIWIVANIAGGPFYEEGIQKRLPRYDKCLNNGSEYVEK